MKNIRIVACCIQRSRIRVSRSASAGPGRNPAGTSPLRVRGPPTAVTTRKPKNARMATLTMIAVVTRLSAAASGINAFSPYRAPSSMLRRDRRGAERTFLFLTGCVRAARRAGDHERRVDRHRVSVDGDHEAVEPARRGSQLVFAGLVVLRAVARAFEPLRLHAERDLAAEVHAALVERHEPARQH